VNAVSNDALIGSAQAVLHPHVMSGYGSANRRLGHVGSTLVTDAGHLYSGVCIDTGCGTGFCAEHAAIAAMVTAREYRIAKIVAVHRDDEGALRVLPPCGRCREFIRQIDLTNLDAEVVLSRTHSVRLRDLLPCNGWPDPLD
jgi:cytidine deaminase